MPFAALIRVSRTCADSETALRADLRFAGMSLLEYQARQCAAAGAESIHILVPAVTPEISRIVDHLSRDHIKLFVARDLLALMRDMPRDRDIVMLADGAFIEDGMFLELARIDGSGLMTVRDGPGSVQFERIDDADRWAGAARMSPEIFYATLDMLGDWDLELTLLRRVVQSGARRFTVSEDDLTSGRVALIDSQAAADVVGRSLLVNGIRSSSEPGVEARAMLPMAERLAQLLLRAQVPAIQIWIGSVVVATLGLFSIALGAQALGLALNIVAALVSLAGNRLDSMGRRTASLPPLSVATAAITLVSFVVLGQMAMLLHDSLYLALLIGGLTLAARLGRIGRECLWAVLTPAGASLLLLIAIMAGQLAAGFFLIDLVAITSALFVLLQSGRRI